MAKVFQLASIPYDKNLGQYFKRSREAAGLTQGNLSEELGLKSSQFISNVERGICAYTIDQLPIVVELCAIDREQLIEHFMTVYREYITANI